MDFSQLANEAITKLAPFLPALISGTAEGLAQRVPDGIARLWETIKNGFKGRPAAEAAIEDLSKKPTDQDNVAAFRKEVRKLLEENSEAFRLISEIISGLPKTFEDSPIQIIRDNVVSGNMNVEQKTEIRK